VHSQEEELLAIQDHEPLRSYEKNRDTIVIVGIPSYVKRAIRLFSINSKI